MLTDIPRGTEGTRRQPGTWDRLLSHTPDPDFQPFWTAIVWCPDCGRGLLASTHAIAENGQISPSLGHPTSYPPCGWHTNPRLIGWTPQTWPLPQRPDFHTCERCGRESRQVGGWGTWSKGSGIICGDCFPAHLADCVAMAEAAAQSLRQVAQPTKARSDDGSLARPGRDQMNKKESP